MFHRIADGPLQDGEIKPILGQVIGRASLLSGFVDLVIPLSGQKDDRCFQSPPDKFFNNIQPIHRPQAIIHQEHVVWCVWVNLQGFFRGIHPIHLEMDPVHAGHQAF